MPISRSAARSDAKVQVPDPKPTPQLSDSVFELFSLKGKVALITGGGAGIGYAVAQAMAEAGANVALWYNSNKKAIEKAEGLEKQYGIKAKAYQCGVTKWEDVKATVEQVEKDFGRIDVFVANAGAGMPGGVLENSIEGWQKIVDTNYTGVFYCAKAVGEIFKKQGSGSFIATSSMSGHIANIPTNQPCYNSTKAAVRHLCKSLAWEWKDFARVNTISPGYIDTDMGAPPQMKKVAFEMAALGRQGDVRELKGAYLYLASNASTFTTGIDILVDGGYCIP